MEYQDDHKVARGRHAWSRIQATAAEQRQLWRIVGEALLVGRKKNPSNQAFGTWCIQMGFDMDASVRSNAMWYAESWRDCKTAPVDMTHPTNLRQWHREQPKVSLPADLQDIVAKAKVSVELDQRSAERLAKVINRAKSGGEGSELAQKHWDAVTKKHDYFHHQACGKNVW